MSNLMSVNIVRTKFGMSSIEKQLLDALRLTKANSLDEREAVYEKAIKALKQLPADNAERISGEILQAITNIERTIGKAQVGRKNSVEEELQSALAQEILAEDNEPPEVDVDIDEADYIRKGPKDSIRKLGLNRHFSGRNVRYLAILGIAVFLLMAIVIFFANLLEGDPDSANIEAAVKAADTQTSEPFETVVSNTFPSAFDEWEERRPKNASLGSGIKIPDDTTLLSFDVTFLSKKFHPVEASNDYLIQLTFNLPDEFDSNALLPVLNAGVMAFDADKKPLPGKGRFLLSAHKGRLVLGTLVIKGRQVSLSGVLTGQSDNPEEGFPVNAAFFRTFISVRMEKSTIPIELDSYNISAIN